MSGSPSPVLSFRISAVADRKSGSSSNSSSPKELLSPIEPGPNEEGLGSPRSRDSKVIGVRLVTPGVLGMLGALAVLTGRVLVS